MFTRGYINQFINILIGGAKTILKNMKVSWDSHPYFFVENKNVANHQPVYF